MTPSSTSLSPDDFKPADTLFNRVLDLKSRMADNFLQFHWDKAEVLVIGPEGERERNFYQSYMSRNHLFDSDLNFIPHVRHHEYCVLLF